MPPLQENMTASWRVNFQKSVPNLQEQWMTCNYVLMSTALYESERSGRLVRFHYTWSILLP
ncbi:hypothetical protein J6590_098612 [Homalodisca vitripennis]|nr:hypothetical protein J6590_098612 [Homalodisca vitripennis]